MQNYEIHYELKGRMSAENGWDVIGYASSKELLDQMLEKYKPTWRYLVWNTYRAAPLKDKGK